MKKEDNLKKEIIENKALNKDILSILLAIIESVTQLRVRLEKTIEDLKLEKGDKGDAYTLDQDDINYISNLVLEGIEIPPPEKYEMTMEDKQAIANLITPPVVEKVIEKTEIIKEVPVVKERVLEVIPQEKIDTIEKNIENNLPKFGTVFRDALELLQDDEKLELSAIRGLRDILNKLEEEILTSHRKSLGGDMRGLNIFVNEVDKNIIQYLDFKAGTGISLSYSNVNNIGRITIDSTVIAPTIVINELVSFSGTTGTLAFTPTSTDVLLLRGGVGQQVSVDYTRSNTVITLTVPASPGEIFLATYTH